MNEESEQKNQFRLILQNIMEPIIIVSKTGIEVVNEQFLNYFRLIIMSQS